MKRAFLLAILCACGGGKPTPPTTPSTTVVYEDWRPLSYGVVLAPAPTSDRVDVIFHFHAGKAAEKEYRAAGANIAIVAITVAGLGTTPYWDLMDDPTKFDAMKSELAKNLSKHAGHEVALGRIALFGWSAGYASIQRILAIPRYYESVDALVLLDGPHTGYVANTKKAQIQTVAPFVRFAHDAKEGKKLFVMTHSSIVPGDYASTTEVADALAEDLGAPWTFQPRPGPPNAYRAADIGNAHLRGFWGQQARDHVIHDHFVKDVIDTWLVPRWR